MSRVALVGWTRTWLGIAVALGTLVPASALVGSVAPEESAPPTAPRAPPAPAVAAWFEENLGQADARVRFIGHFGDGVPWLFTTTGAAAVIPTAGRGPPAMVRLEFEGGHGALGVRGDDRLPGVANHYRGDDPAAWVTGAPRYGRVIYAEPWPGVDVTFYSNAAGDAEFDLVVAPGGDPAAPRLRVEGADVSLDAEGALVLGAGDAGLRFPPPRTYQDVRGHRTEVASGYALLGESTVGFHVGAYDVAAPLVIDPVGLTYGTHLGGSTDDFGGGVAVDAAGNVYFTGSAFSADFPTANALQPASASPGRFDAFVAKVGPQGNLIYSTYLGGGDSDTGGAVALDGSGNLWVAGTTVSTNFPLRNPFQATQGGGGDLFATKLDSQGRIAFSTYLGGVGTEEGGVVVVDGSGNAFVAGSSFSGTTFPTRNPSQAVCNGGAAEAVLAKFAPAGGLLFSTCFGGSCQDRGNALALDPAGGVYLAGWTCSADYPTRNPFQSVKASTIDAFAAKFTSAGALVYSTYLGGAANDVASGVAADASGSAYVTGHVVSADFPRANALQTAYGGGTTDAFVVKLAPAGNALAYSTYLGGSAGDVGYGIAVDAGGRAYVVGETSSANFPTLAGDYQTGLRGGIDGFLTELGPQGNTLVTSTYAGGFGADRAGSVALGSGGAVYLTGTVRNGDFPTTADAIQRSVRGGEDAFLAVFKPCDTPRTTVSLAGTPGDAGWWRSNVVASFAVQSVCSATTSVSIDGGAFAVAAGPVTVAGDGAHTLRFFSRDRAGNTEATRSVDVRIDATAPTVTLTKPRLGRTYVDGTETASTNDPRTTIVIGDILGTADNQDATSGPARVEWYVDGSLRATANAAPYAFDWRAGREADGDHVLEARGFDVAGNRASRTLTVRTQAGPLDVVCRDIPTIIETIRVPVAGVVGLLGAVIPLPDEVHRIVKQVGFRCEPLVGGPGGPGNPCGEILVDESGVRVAFSEFRHVDPNGIATLVWCLWIDVQGVQNVYVGTSGRFDYFHTRQCGGHVDVYGTVPDHRVRERYGISC